MLLNTKTNVKRSGMILLIVVAFLSMFLVVGTTYLLVADSIRRTSDFDLNATDKRSDFALMPDIDPRYMFNFALGQILYDVVDPTAFDGTGKILTTNSALRGHSLATNMYGVYEPQATATATVNPINGQISSISVVSGGSGYTVPPRIIIEGGGGSGATAVATLNNNGLISAINVISPGSNYTSQPTIYVGVPNDRPFQGAGKNPDPVLGELDFVNYTVFGLTPNGLVDVSVRDPQKGFRGGPPVYSRWNPPYTFPDKNHTYLGKYAVLKVSGKINNGSDMITNVTGEINELRTGMLIDFVPGGDVDALQVIAAHPPAPLFISAIDLVNATIKLNQFYLPNPVINSNAVRNFSVVSLIPSFQRDPITWLPAAWLPRTIDNSYVVDPSPNPPIDPNRHRTLRPRPFDQLTAAELVTFTGPGVGSFPSPTDPGFIATLNAMISNNKIFPYPEADGMDVKNLEGYPGGNDSIWIDAGFPVMTTPDGRKYKALIAPLILDLDGRINLNVAGNLMQRSSTNPYFADHASNQGWGRWEINPQGLIDAKVGRPVIDPNPPNGLLSIPVVSKGWYYDFPPTIQISGGGGTGATATAILVNKSVDSIRVDNAGTGYTSPPNVQIIRNGFNNGFNEFLNPLSYSTTSGDPASTFQPPPPPNPPINQWKTYGRLFQTNYLPINSNPPPVTNFLTTSPHSYAQVDFNGAGDFGVWGSTIKPTFVNANGFPTFGQGFGNGQASEHLLDGVTLSSNYHARNFNPNRTQSSANGVSTVFPVSETASILRWQGKGKPFSKSQLAELLPKSLGLDMPYASAGSSLDTLFRHRIRNMLTTLSADLDRPAMVPIAPDTLPPPFGAGYANNFKTKNFIFPDRSNRFAQAGVTYYSPIADTVSPVLNQTSPPLKFNLDRPLTAFPPVVQNGMSDQTNFINYTAGPIKAQFDQAVNDRQAFAMDIYNLLRNVTGVIFYELAKNSMDPAVQADLMEIKKTNRWFAQLTANIVDFIDADDFNTVFNWNTGDAKDVVFGVELPRVVINEVYSMAQNDSTDTFMNNTKATKKSHLFTAIELMNPLPMDNFYSVGPGGHNAVLQFKNAAGTEYQNYKLVLCKREQVSGQMNAVNGNYFNNTGSHDFNGTNIAMDSNNPSMMDPDVMDKAILDNWTDPNNMPMANMVPATWYLNAGGFMVIGDDTSLRMEADPKINTTFKTKKIKLQTIGEVATPGLNHAPEIMLQKLVYPGMTPNDLDPLTGVLVNAMLPYNPYITVDVFTKGKMWDLRKYNSTELRDPAPVVTNTSSSGRKSPFLDSLGMDPDSEFSKNMYNGKNTVNQMGGNGGAQHTMGQGMAIGQINSDVLNPLPWLTHFDRQLINPLELIHVSTVKPHELTQTACRWNDAFDQPSIMANNVPAKISYPYAHNWPWFDENTRLYRVLEAVGVSPLQAGEAMHGRVLGKVNVNTMHSEEVFQAVADATVANNFTAAEVTTGYNNLIGQKPILSFGQANQPANQSALGVKTGLNKSLMGYPDSSNTPYKNFLDNDSPDPMNPLFPSTGTNVATYARKELLTKIGNSVTTKSNVFAVWITTGYFEVRDDSTQPPKLGAEIGKADGINIRHRMFAIVDRTNMKAGDITYRTSGGISNTTSFGFNTTVNKNPDNSFTLATSPLWVSVPVPPPIPSVPTTPHFVFTHPITKFESIITNAFAGMILVLNPNTDYEETVQLEVVGGGLGFYVRKEHFPTRTPTAIPQVFNSINNFYSIINRGNPGPWIGYDRTKDREVVPYAEIIE